MKNFWIYSTFQVSEVHNRGRDTAVPCPYGNRRAIGVYFINVESAVYQEVGREKGKHMLDALAFGF